MLKLSPTLLQLGVHLQYPDAPSEVSQSPGAVVFLKAAILFSWSWLCFGSLSAGSTFFFYGDSTSQISISLLDPDISIMYVLREGNSPWVWKQFPPSHSFSVPAGLGISIACLAIMPENPKAISWDEIQREPRSLPYQRVFLLARHPFCSSAHWCCFGEFRSFVMCLRTAFALVVEGIKVLPKCSLNPAEMVSERGNRH